MEPRNYFTAIARGWVIIAVATVLGLLAGLGLSALRPTSYEANASGILAVENVENGSDLWQTSNAGLVLARSYADLVTTPMVTDKVAESVEGVSSAQAAGALSADVPLESLNITVAATDGDAQRAADIANAAVTALQESITEVSPSTPAGTPAVTFHVTEQASVPSSAAGLSTGLLAAIGGVAGLALGVLLALLRAPSTTRREVETVQP